MSKYIIEVPVDAQYIMINGVRMGDCYTQTTYIADIEELNSDYINEHYGSLQDDAYQRGLEDGKQTAIGAAELREKLEYQKGFEDGKAVNDKGCEGCMWEGNPYDACEQCSNAYKNLWTAMQKTDEIKVGDEVTDLQSDANFVVTHLWENNHGDKGVSGFNHECSAFQVTINKVKKTGRHFDIAKILEDMRND